MEKKLLMGSFILLTLLLLSNCCRVNSVLAVMEVPDWVKPEDVVGSGGGNSSYSPPNKTSVGTSSPTAIPTSRPTIKPTVKPTLKPTITVFATPTEEVSAIKETSTVSPENKSEEKNVFARLWQEIRMFFNRFLKKGN